MNETNNKPNVSIGGNMIGNVGDGDFMNTGQIAMGDILLGGQPVPKTKEAFAEQLATLQALLKEALAKEEFAQTARWGKGSCFGDGGGGGLDERNQTR